MLEIAHILENKVNNWKCIKIGVEGKQQSIICRNENPEAT